MDFGTAKRVVVETTSADPVAVYAASCKLMAIFCSSVGLTGLPVDPEDETPPPVVLPPQTITSMTPQTGPDGTLVTITGLNFGPQGPNCAIGFGSQPGTIQSWSDTQMTCIANQGGYAPGEPLGVWLVRDDGTSVQAGMFSFEAVVLEDPVVGGISPTTGVDGAEVTIVRTGGGGFGPEEGASVTIGDEECPVIAWNDAEIIVAALQGGSPPDIPMPVIVHTADGRQSNTQPAPGFTFTAAAREGEAGSIGGKRVHANAKKGSKKAKDVSRPDTDLGNPPPQERPKVRELAMPEFPSGGGLMLTNHDGSKIVVGPFAVEAGKTYVLPVLFPDGIAVVNSGGCDVTFIFAP